MKTETQLTAVEWLVEQITNKVGYYSKEVQQEIYQQAKAMEKEQSLKMLPYDLDELADEHANQFMDGKDHFYGFKAGFQKALELLTFKSE